MNFYLNDLSLHNQFLSLHDFSISLDNIFLMRSEIKKNNNVLYCFPTLLESIICNDKSLAQLVNNLERDKKDLLYTWLYKNGGPFWITDRKHSPNDYFEYDEELITNSSIAEAAFNSIEGTLSSTISFTPSNFELSPLLIKWVYNDPEFKAINLNNYWLVQSIIELLFVSEPDFDSWDSLIKKIENKFPSFELLDSFSEGLHGEPFNLSIANRAFQLIFYLNEYKDSLNADNSPSVKTNEIITKFFTGKNALFSDSSTTEKNDPLYKSKLTIEGNFYPMHGKIRHRTFRLHFSWPILKEKNTILAYLGQKLTKK
jgi:hypothetical protein